MHIRRAVPWIASIAFLLGVATLAITRAYSSDHSEIYRSAAIDFAVSLIDLAITVGVVDLLIKSYSEHQLVQSITPRAEELRSLVSQFRTAQNEYLGERTSVADLERCRRLVVSIQHFAFDLHTLVSTSSSVLASDLLKLSHDMRELSETIEDAITFTRNVSVDTPTWVQKVIQNSKQISEFAGKLNTALADEYDLQKASA